MPARCSLIVADDEHTPRALFCKIAESLGYRPISAASSDQAVSSAKTAPAPCIMILDMLLPGSSGHHVLSELKPKIDARELEVIVVTGGPISSSDERLARRLGAMAYLRKPIPNARLRAAITEADSRLRTRNSASSIEINLDRRTIRWGQAVSPKLSRGQMVVMRALVEAHPRPVSRETLLDLLYAGARSAEFNLALTAEVARLKRKLPPQLAGQIAMLRGQGYRLLAETRKRRSS